SVLELLANKLLETDENFWDQWLKEELCANQAFLAFRRMGATKAVQKLPEFCRTLSDKKYDPQILTHLMAMIGENSEEKIIELIKAKRTNWAPDFYERIRGLFDRLGYSLSSKQHIT
ncbi:hypothetical protein K8T06_11265, partial [bacterium]|nr:hypothetical protein [bacterium]